MTTEKFTEAAETFKKNVNDTMKWLQDTTSTIIETQNKQIKSASDIYNKAMNTAFAGINKDNFNSSFGVSEKVAEILQKNIDTISNMSKAALKTAMDFGKQAGSETFSKESTTKIIESYKKQVEEITAFNKKTFESLTAQFDATKTSSAELAEKFKKEFDATVAASKEKIQSIIDSYSKVAKPTVETNKELFNKLNDQMNANFNTNLKFWSDLTSAYGAKSFDTKNVADFFKNNPFNTTNGTQKKHETSVK